MLNTKTLAHASSLKGYCLFSLPAFPSPLILISLYLKPLGQAAYLVSLPACNHQMLVWEVSSKGE